jgi:hypothetical protein
MNNTSIPPMNTINRIYWNQNLWCIKPPIRHINIICISSIIPIERGRFIWVNIILSRVLVAIIIFISGNSLI